MQKSLKILLVLPIYGGSLPIGEYCVSALRDLGHRVEVFQAQEFQEAQRALLNMQISGQKSDFLQNTLANLLSEAVYAKAERFMPDFVFALAQAPLTRAVLKRFERDKVPTAMWFVEDHTVFNYWRAYANLYTHFFVIQKEPFLTLLRDNTAQAHYLPLAALPSFHKKRELNKEEEMYFGADFAFLGAGYANRRQEFRKLLTLKQGVFKIWGSDWGKENILAPYIQKQGKRVSPEESVKIYNATKININLHSSIHATGAKKGDFVNPRTFELASMQAFQLVDKRELMPELFDLSNKELVTFEDFDEVPELIEYYLKHEEERREIAQRGAARVLKDHTYQQRMKTMLEIVSPDTRTFESFEPYLRNMPKEMRQEFYALSHRLGFSPLDDFSEIVRTIRCSTTASNSLTSLEASILFLDEWHKQYG